MKTSSSTRKILGSSGAGQDSLLTTPTSKMNAFVASLLPSDSKNKLSSTQHLPKTEAGRPSPSKKLESPRANRLKTSVSQHQLTYTIVTPSAAQQQPKAFQPVLTKKIELSGSKTPTSSSQVRRSTNSASALAEKKTKSGVKQVGLIKEQPFNYEQKLKGEESFKDISKTLASQYDQPIMNETDIRQPADQLNQDQLLLFAPGSFHHSRLNSGFVVDPRKFEAADNSYRVLVEENKSDGKNPELEQPDERFEVIREDSFVSPYRPGDFRDNSDFKKFTAEDDEGRWMAKDPYADAQKANHFGSTQRRLVTLGQTEEEDGTPVTLEDLEDTPQNIKNRAKKGFFEQPETTAGQNAFISQINDLNQERKHALLQEHQENFLQQNQAHVLSFSEDNPLINQADTEQQQNNPNPMSSFFGSTQPSANTIIEMEKNYVILQYETLLQQLTSEFSKVLAKAKDTDEHIAQQEVLIQKQSRIMNEKDQAFLQQQNVNSQLSLQVQELLDELDSLSQEKQRRQETEAQNEEICSQRDELEQTLQTLQSKLRFYESNEASSKDQVEQLHLRLRAQDQRIRQKDEEIFSYQRILAANERDVQGYRDMENAMKLELQRAMTSRMAVEESLQELRQKSSADQILLKVRENEIENLAREIKSIKASIETMQQSYTQVMRENDQLKSALNDHERSSIQMKGLFQSRDSQITSLESDVHRLSALVEMERQRSNRVEEDYRRKIDQLQNELTQARREVESANMHHANARSYDSRGDRQSSYRHSADSDIGAQDVDNFNDIKVGISSPNQEIKSAINWMSSLPQTRNIVAKQPQSVVPQAQRINREDQSSLIARRKTINQNASQQQDLLSWDKQGNLASSYKSQERQQPTYQQATKVTYTMENIHFSPKGDTVQAAGMKSKLDTSPFTQTQETHQKQLSQLQTTLSQMQIDKERVENEYRKLGTSKNKMQIQKKQELEFEVEVINKNIHQIKQKLRELNAF